MSLAGGASAHVGGQVLLTGGVGTSSAGGAVTIGGNAVFTAQCGIAALSDSSKTCTGGYDSSGTCLGWTGQDAIDDNGSSYEIKAGSIATAGGLVFIGATTDQFVRGFDSRSGEELWKHRLPYTANATPITYRLGPESKQYLVVPAGGHGWSAPGDAVIAFALP